MFSFFFFIALFLLNTLKPNKAQNSDLFEFVLAFIKTLNTPLVLLILGGSLSDLEQGWPRP